MIARLQHLSFWHRRFGLLVYALLCAMLANAIQPSAALAQGQEPALIVGAGETVDGNVATTSQDIRVDGAVSGDVTSWSGNIEISGTVGGDVVSYTGSVRIAATGRVAGHVLASNAQLHVEKGASVAGQVITAESGGALASVIDVFLPSSNTGGVGVFGRVLLAAVLAVLMIAFCALFAAFWPRRVANASVTLQQFPGRALALGLLTTLVLMILAMPLAGLLLASVIGLPVLLLVAVLALVPYVYGLVVLARTLVARTVGNSARPAAFDSRATAIVVILVAVVALVGVFVPLWGIALYGLLASPGVGAVILSRGGLALPLRRAI